MAYAGNPYAPIVKMGEHLLVWSRASWHGYVANYIEPLPLSSQSIVDFGNVAASGAIAAALVQTLRLDDFYLVEIWMRPLTDVEIMLWLLQGQQKFRIKQAGFRVSLQTGLVDPYWESTRFYCLGKDQDPFIEIRNPSGYAEDAIVAFWGNKYLIKAVPEDMEQQMIAGARPAARVVAEARIS